jgi:hypothetical protein
MFNTFKPFKQFKSFEQRSRSDRLNGTWFDGLGTKAVEEACREASRTVEGLNTLKLNPRAQKTRR